MSLHGDDPKTARSIVIRILGLALMVPSVLHMYEAGVDSVVHTVVTMVMFFFGAWATWPEGVATFVGLFAPLALKFKGKDE